MPGALLIDTDVLIDYLRGDAQAVSYLEGLEGIQLLSVISVAELYAGVREGSERQALDDFVETFEQVHVDTDVASKGGLFRRDYGKSHGTGLADALIAASAVVRGACLVTLNTKHFPMLDSVIVPYRKS